MSHFILAFALALGFALPKLAVSAPAPPPAKVFVVLRDLSASYCCAAQATARLARMVRELPPGSRLYLVDISTDFSARNVPVILDIPHAPPAGPRNTLQGRIAEKERIDRFEQTVAALKAPVIRFLKRPIATRSKWTRLHAAMAYASRLLGASPAADRYLMIFSDMVHEEPGGLMTGDPPVKGVFAVKGVRVGQFFVPYHAGFSKKEEAWRLFWVRQGAAEVRMVDEMLSRVAPLY